ncbi:unnamed protein product [Caenorhabditis brenneri]
MAQAPTHPLLNLPDDDVIRKIRKMSLQEVLKFSLISERSKGLVTSIQIKGTHLIVCVQNKITVSIEAGSRSLDLTYYLEPDMYWGMGAYGRKKKLRTPRSVLVEETNHTDNSENTSSELKNSDFTMKNWLDHLQQIFHLPKIDHISFSNRSSDFDIDDVKKVFETATGVDIGDTGCHDFNQLVLQKYVPIDKLNFAISQNSRVPKNTLIQNFVDLDFTEIGDWETTTVKLDELLLMNSRVIGMDSIMPAKQLNKFLKLWQKGSNPRMEYLGIFYKEDEEIDNEIILKGIKNRVISKNTIREFKLAGNKQSDMIEGGIDIVRIDGVEATIRIVESGILPSLEILLSLRDYNSHMAQAPAHPLLNLPDDEIIRELREISLEEILRFSLISKKCKDLVKFINLHGTSIHVNIANDITVSIKTISRQINLSYYTEPDTYWGEGVYGRKKRLTPPQSVLIDRVTAEREERQPSKWKWKTRGCTMKAWLKHLQNVFNYHKIDYIWFRENSSQFDIDGIKEAIGNIAEVYIGNTGCLVFNQMILRNFLTIEELTIMRESFLGSKIPPSLLVQNFVKLNFTQPTNITLNDLLLINSKVITVKNPHQSQKLLNNFIKLWQRGSNPHMEYLSINYFGGDANDEQIVMKGIKHELNPPDRRRYLKSVGSNYLGPACGGMDIYRMDGMKATVTCRESNGISVWHMYTTITKRLQLPSAIMAAIPTFPLFGLPDDVVLQTLRVMDLKQIFMFSLISERCKDLVSSIQIKGTYIHVSIKNYITISVQTFPSRITLSYYTERNKYWGVGTYGRKKKLTPPLSVLINEELSTRQPTKWEKRDFTMETWLEHVQNVFNFHKIDCISFSGRSFQFDIDDIKEVFGNVTKITIENTGRFAFNQMILQHFFTTEELTIMPENFLESKIPPRFLMRNLVKLNFTRIDLDEPTNITLNDLLLMNSNTVYIEQLQMPSEIMNAIQTFPLLDLPVDEILRTLRVMDLKQIFMFSLISKRCKDLVSSIQIKGASFSVLIGNSITIHIGTVSSRMSFSCYTEPNNYWGEGAYGRKKKLTSPQSVLIDEDIAEQLTIQPSESKKCDLTMKTWLEHLQCVFNYHKIDSIWFQENSSEFDMDDIKKVFGNTTDVTFHNAGHLALDQSILQNFFPIEELQIIIDNFQDSKTPPSFLMQNLVRLSIVEVVTTNITLNDLLLINSKVITVETPQLPQKLLNNFIKLWQKGSNPNLEYLSFDYLNGEENEEQIVMHGIKHTVNPFDRVKKFKSVGSVYLGPARGGMDIYRMDGVRATITYRKVHEFSVWEMFVWMDHCAVES